MLTRPFLAARQPLWRQHHSPSDRLLDSEKAPPEHRHATIQADLELFNNVLNVFIIILELRPVIEFDNRDSHYVTHAIHCTAMVGVFPGMNLTLLSRSICEKKGCVFFYDSAASKDHISHKAASLTHHGNRLEGGEDTSASCYQEKRHLSGSGAPIADDGARVSAEWVEAIRLEFIRK